MPHLESKSAPHINARVLAYTHNPPGARPLTVRGDQSVDAIPCLPDNFVDLLILDPPYNLDKSFNQNKFKSLPSDEYAAWIDSWLGSLRRVLKTTASIYLCSDWRSSSAIQQVIEKYFIVQNNNVLNEVINLVLVLNLKRERQHWVRYEMEKKNN